jgi:hypothetical protein
VELASAICINGRQLARRPGPRSGSTPHPAQVGREDRVLGRRVAIAACRPFRRYLGMCLVVCAQSLALVARCFFHVLSQFSYSIFPNNSKVLASFYGLEYFRPRAHARTGLRMPYHCRSRSGGGTVDISTATRMNAWFWVAVPATSNLGKAVTTPYKTRICVNHHHKGNSAASSPPRVSGAPACARRTHPTLVRTLTCQLTPDAPIPIGA